MDVRNIDTLKVKLYRVDMEDFFRKSQNLRGVERLDLLLIHRPDPLCDAGALGACLDRLIDDGKVRGVGVSNFMPWDADLLQSRMRHRLQLNQIELSLLHTAPFTDGQLAHAQQHRMPVMAWSPLGGGRLHTQAQKAQRRLGKNRSGHADTGLNHHRLNNSGNHMTQENSG